MRRRALTLRSKFILLCVLTTTVVLVVVGAAQYATQRKQATTSLVAAVEGATVRLSANLAPAVWNLQKDQAFSQMATEMSLPDISAIVIKEETGAVFSGIVRAEGRPAPLPESFTPPAHALSKSFEIHWEGQRIARGELYFVHDFLESRLNEQLVSTLAATAVVELVLLLVLVLILGRLILRPVRELTRVMEAIVRTGELDQQIPIHSDDEIGELARGFQSMSSSLRAVIAQLREAAGALEVQASDILGTSSRQAAVSSQQASAINETSTTVNEIAQTAKQATEYADSVIQLAQRSEELSHDGQRAVTEASAGLEKLTEQVRAIAGSITALSDCSLRIGDIIGTVKDLAEQSNLLALNAAIEASKAGEQGRGFAVVAMEMRTLAEQSKAAAGEVRVILSEILKGTRAAVSNTEEGSKRAQAAVELARSAGNSITGLAEVIRDSSLAARHIANNTRQQTVGVEQIVGAIGGLATAMADAVDGTRRIETVAGNLTTLSKSLSSLVNQYRV